MKKILSVCICLAALLLLAGCSYDVRLGKTDSGAVVTFTRVGSKEYGLSINRAEGGALEQSAPARVYLCTDGQTLTVLEASYNSVKPGLRKVEAKAEIEAGGSVYFFEDLWRIEGESLLLDRKVTVSGTQEGAGFCSATSLVTPAQWADCKYFIPGVIYGDPHTTDYSKGGRAFYDAGYFSLREDYLSAPLAVVADDGGWFGLLNRKPDGATTWEESTAAATDCVVEPSLGFGTLEVAAVPDGGVGISFIYPGTCREFSGGGPFRSSNTPVEAITRIRLHPVQDGFTQEYQLAFLLGYSDQMPDIERDAWQRAWAALDPKVEKVDLEQMRTALLDHLASQVIEYKDRAGIPFVIDAKTGKPGSFRPPFRSFPSRSSYNPDIPRMQTWARQLGIDLDPTATELEIWEYAVLGFCGKHVEIAEQFLLEAYRDKGEQGIRFSQLAEEIMASLVKYVPLDPPIGEGLNLRTGKVGNIHGGNSWGLRPIPEDLARLMDMLEREKERGVQHPQWLAWGKSFADWLLPLQRPDGSFPAAWGDDGAVSDQSGALSYAPVPFLVKLSNFTGENRYKEAAVKAAEYIWNEYGAKGVYQGATGTSSVADKESGMLSAEAFMTLYEDSKDGKWLQRARAAADYAETWIWIWNVPMPEGADPDLLGWKPGVPTTGANGIGSNDVGGVDQYLDWAVPIYAKLYKYTGDEHEKDVAYVLLHGTKAMLALPGRTYDMAGPGWQQEHWRMNPIRGIGAHRTWLPWISINHLHGVTALEEFDPELYEELK